jgi:hypothetical protein
MQTFNFLMYKIPTELLTESSWWHTNCITSWCQSFAYPNKDVWITMYMMYCHWTYGCHHHFHACSTRIMLNGLMLQQNPNCNPNWKAYVSCQYYHFDVNIAYFLQKGKSNWYNINTFNVPFDLTASTFFTRVHTPVAERKNSDKNKKSQADLRVVTVVMQSVGGL